MDRPHGAIYRLLKQCFRLRVHHHFYEKFKRGGKSVAGYRVEVLLVDRSPRVRFLVEFAPIRLLFFLLAFPRADSKIEALEELQRLDRDSVADNAKEQKVIDDSACRANDGLVRRLDPLRYNAKIGRAFARW